MCLVQVLPNLKLHQKDKLFFDENGIEVLLKQIFVRNLSPVNPVKWFFKSC